ncbi:MAG: restriction endonuclease subunit S, partial [Bacteroidia bacterium]|nr:restriction endonuclease subunit S [Bacteroidia bacterium]
MRKYDSYKDSGIEWIGVIPKHWESTRLKFVGESIIGIIYSPDDVVNEGEGLLVLRSSNIQDGKLAFEDCVFVDKEVQEKHLTKEGDILLCARNGSAHLVGKSAYIGKENEGVTFGAFMSIVRSDLNKYLFYFFNSQVFKAQTGLFSTSTINQLTSDTLNNMFISFPKDEQEQTAIAAYLDRKTAEIDDLIADKKRLLELYEEEKTAIINQAVTKGINPDVPMKDSGIEWLEEIPEHWEVKRIRHVAQIFGRIGYRGYKTTDLVSKGEGAI